MPQGIGLFFQLKESGRSFRINAHETGSRDINHKSKGVFSPQHFYGGHAVFTGRYFVFKLIKKFYRFVVYPHNFIAFPEACFTGRRIFYKIADNKREARYDKCCFV